jgi:hypothetical protein
LALDQQVVLFTLVLTVLTGALFGLLPALSASRGNLSAVLYRSAGRPANLVLGEGLRLALFGIAAGSIAAGWLTRFLARRASTRWSRYATIRSME